MGLWQKESLSGDNPTTVWPSGLRRWLQAAVRKGVGSNPTAVRSRDGQLSLRLESYRHISAITGVKLSGLNLRWSLEG